MRKVSAATIHRTLIVLLSTVSLVASPVSAAVTTSTKNLASVTEQQSPRRANYFLKEVTPANYDALAEYDLLVLPAELQEYNPAASAELRKRNADIILLAYVPTISYNTTHWFDNLHKKLLANIHPSWWVTNTSGKSLSIWPGTQAINIASEWQYALPHFVASEIMSTNFWDGVFYDEFGGSIHGALTASGDIDIMKDGKPDNVAMLDNAWRAAATTILSYTRELLGPNAIIITNGDSDPVFAKYANGRMFEAFPTPWEGKGRWQDTVASYLRLNTPAASAATSTLRAASVSTKPVAINIINGTTGDTGNYTDLQDMRFTLTTTLLGDGYFSYDHGIFDHGQTAYTFEDELTKIGKATGKATNYFNPAQKTITDDVWYRTYQYATVFVNARNKPVTINLIKNKYVDAQGKSITKITIPAQDGIILMRK